MHLPTIVNRARLMPRAEQTLRLHVITDNAATNLTCTHFIIEVYVLIASENKMYPIFALGAQHISKVIILMKQKLEKV